MSALPKEISKKARKAEKLHAEAYGNPEAAGGQNIPQATQASVSETDGKPPLTVVENQEGTDKSGQPSLTSEVQEVVAPSFQTTAEPFEGGGEPSKVVEEDEQKWEARYATIEGKYRKEVPRLHKQVRELTSELESVHKVLSSLDKQAAASPANSDVVRLLKDDEIADYGEDLIGVVKRAAREEISPELDALRAENELLRGSIKTVGDSSSFNALERVYDTLDGSVANWREINNDPNYLKWLGEFDMYAGRTRQEMLSEAFESHDAARVVKFFRGYLKENSVVTPESTPDTPRTPKVDLAELAAPGAPRASSQRAPEGKRMWRQGEIAAFYSDVRRGKYRDKDADKYRIEQDIVSAGNEGRITA